MEYGDILYARKSGTSLKLVSTVKRKDSATLVAWLQISSKEREGYVLTPHTYDARRHSFLT